MAVVFSCLFTEGLVGSLSAHSAAGMSAHQCPLGVSIEGNWVGPKQLFRDQNLRTQQLFLYVTIPLLKVHRRRLQDRGHLQ